MAADEGLGKIIPVFLEILLHVQLIRDWWQNWRCSYPFGLTINGTQSLHDFKLNVLPSALDVVAAKWAKLFEL